MTARGQVVLLAVVLACSTAAAAQQGRDVPKALMTAAEKGSAPAQYAVGATLEAAGDLDGAAAWYSKSAAQGYAGAQFKLGERAERAGNPTAALDWYRLALRGGVAQASERIDALSAPIDLNADTQDAGEGVGPLAEGSNPQLNPEAEPDRAQAAPLEQPQEVIPAFVVQSKSEPVERSGPVSAQGATDLEPMTIAILIGVGLALLIAVPYVFVRASHKRGIVLYSRRRNLLGCAMLTIPSAFVYASLMIVIIGVLEKRSLPDVSFGAALMEQSRDVNEAVWMGAMGAAVLGGLFAPGFHWFAVRRLNPHAGPGEWMLGWLARMLATLPALICLCFFYLAITGGRRGPDDSRRPPDPIARLLMFAALGWLFFGWLDFVCYPDPYDYPALRERSALPTVEETPFPSADGEVIGSAAALRPASHPRSRRGRWIGRH
jgi:hypothetical protein